MLVHSRTPHLKCDAAEEQLIWMQETELRPCSSAFLQLWNVEMSLNDPAKRVFLALPTIPEKQSYVSNLRF